MKKILSILIYILLIHKVSAYDIYNSVSWEQHINESNNLISNYQSTRTFINSQGLQHIRLYYHDSFLTKGKVDPVKIKKIVDLSKQNPELLISFDIEIGHNPYPETVLPTVINILDLYHQFGGKAPVGVYGLLPQNSYGGKYAISSQETLSTLNRQYEIIAKKVNFLSPIFYNYDTDYELWKQSVNFGMKEALKYSKKYNLKIIPYFSISYFIKDNEGKISYIQPLNDTETYKRLNYLRLKKIDGLIIWDSNRFRTKNGVKPIVDKNQGWLKGVRKFIFEYN